MQNVRESAIFVVEIGFKKCTPMKINKDWHDKHPMPSNASVDQRVEWHLLHSRECGCRPIPATLQREIQ